MADKITVGNAEIVFVLDMVPPPRAPSDFFPDVLPEAWAPYADDILDKGNVQLYYGHFFVRSGGKTIMVDTGMGPGPHVSRGNAKGDLLNQLASQGVKPDDIDIVMHTHLHADHVGWNITRDVNKISPTFPKARYLAPRVDWEHFTQADILESSPQMAESVLPLVDLGLLDLIEDEHRITDEITTLSTPGHTPGHQVVLISSQGEKAMIVGDALHSKVQVQEPTWCAGVDTDKGDSHNSRETLLNMSENDGYTIAAGHFHPNDHIGKVIRSEGRRYWQVI